MAMTEEIWKDIPDCDNVYQASTFGRIRSVTKRLLVYNPLKGWYKRTFNGKELKPATDPDGYETVAVLRDKKMATKRVHRLVSEAFIPNPFSLPQINHINGIKTDNRVENLEWCTCEENIQHAYRTGLSTVKWGEDHSQSKTYFNTATGIYYGSGADAYRSVGRKYTKAYFTNMIIGLFPNKTDFIQV